MTLSSALRRYRVNFALIALSLLMVALVAFGVLGKGKPGTLTWGPTVDIWAVSIALDDMYKGEADGLGRRETAVAAAAFLTATKEDMAIGDDQSLVADPAKVDQAWRAAAHVYTPELPPAGLDSKRIISTMAEDIGYSDFYAYAFRIFGVDGMSTYYLFVTLLALSVVFFAAGNWRSQPALALLSIATASFFLLTTGSETFTVSAPHIAANRFTATLIVIPALHVLAFALDRERPSRTELGFLVLQAALFAFCMTLRSSATWALLGLVGIGVVILALRVVRWRMGQTERPSGFLASAIAIPGIARLGGAIVLVMLLTTGWQSYRASQLGVAYETQDILPHHLRWHSAALGLALHPDWPRVLPWPELEGARGDGIGMGWYQAYMDHEMPNTPALSPIHGSYRFGWSEVVMKNEVMSFIKAHPVYTAQVYLFHKPVKTLEAIRTVLGGIPLLAWLLAAPSILLAAATLVWSRPAHPVEMAASVTLFTIASWAPVIWAYPAPHVIADQAYVFLFFILFAASAIVAPLAIRAFKLRRSDPEPDALPVS